MPEMIKKDYKTFLAEVKERIGQAQYEALKAVNKELIQLYWDIGKMIVDRQKKYGWGKSIVENLAQDLQKEFPGMKGLSKDNLWRMRKFYLNYSKNLKFAPLVQEISWAKNIVILEYCKDDLEREFYMRMTKKFGWSKNVLIHQIENKTYEKTLQFYLSALDDKVRLPEENPSIGIIICKEKDRTIVEYALRDTSKPIGVATYKITSKLPKNLRKQLPSPEQIQMLIEKN